MADDAQPIIISCVNLKGGVGKTTLAVNLAAYFGRKGLKTLLIDLDPQTNATFHCMKVEDWQKHAAANGTVADLLGVREHTSAEGAKKTAADVVVEDVFDDVDLIPSHLDLFTIDLDLSGAAARETKLRRELKEFVSEYDVVICDCPPNLTIPTQNALAFSTHYIVPVSPDFLSSLGVSLLLSRVQKFSSELENPIELIGIAISRVGRQSYYRQETKQALRAQFDCVLDSELKERSSVSEASAKQKNVFQWGDTQAKDEFTELGDEISESLGL
jgi:chromosome partitioning protein